MYCQSDAFHLPRTRTVFAKKTIMFTGPRYWNELPPEITSCVSINSFKCKFSFPYLLLILQNHGHFHGIFMAIFFPNLNNPPAE